MKSKIYSYAGKIYLLLIFFLTFTFNLNAQELGTVSQSERTAPPDISCSIVGTNLLCNGDANGTTDLTVTGGTAPFSYLWSNGATSEDLSGLSGGDYSVTVTDALGNTTTCYVSIYEPPLLECSIVGTDLLCNGDESGAADLTVIGGTLAYSYAWTGPDGFTSTDEDISGLAAGWYYVTVTDANDCVANCEIELTEPPLLECSIVGTDLLCNGDANGTADLTVTGGTPPYSYLWSNGATTEDLSELSGGDYSVDITDANQCTAYCEVTIEEPPLLECSIVGTDLLCNGDANGTADLTVTGGTPPYSYLWSNGATTEDLSELSGGDYSVDITDANQCTAYCEVTIDEPPLLECQITNVQNASCIDCADGSATVIPIGGTPGFTYLWSDGQTTATASNLLPGYYSVTITDANECTATCDVDIYYDEEEGCTLTPGYWKTHSEYGPASYDPTWALIIPDGEDSEFYYSLQTYYEVLWTPPSGGNAYYILAHQFIAAELNFLNGASPTAAQTAFDEALVLFNNPIHTPTYVKKLKKTDPTFRQYWIDLAEILDDYNNGDIGPGHCDDVDRSADELTGIINKEDNVRLSAYPNPFMNSATIEFTLDKDADVVLDVYNMTGLKVATLHEGKVNANQTYTFNFNGVTHLKQETYMYFLRTGKTVKMGRLVMIR